MHVEDKSTTATDGTYNGNFWFLIGGERESGESTEETAKRELYEETGLEEESYQIGKVVWTGDFELVLSGERRRMKQEFIVVKTFTDSISLENFTENEKKFVKKMKWFTLKEIVDCKDIIYPITLPQYLPDILEGKYPKQPFDIDAGRNPI